MNEGRGRDLLLLIETVIIIVGLVNAEVGEHTSSVRASCYLLGKIIFPSSEVLIRLVVNSEQSVRM